MRAFTGICLALLGVLTAVPAFGAPLHPVFEVDRNWPKQMPRAFSGLSLDLGKKRGRRPGPGRFERR